MFLNVNIENKEVEEYYVKPYYLPLQGTNNLTSKQK